MQTVPPSVELGPWPFFAPDEVAAATAVLQSGRVNYWTGNEGRLFEKEYAEHFGASHAVAMANGTVTLDAALKVLGIGEGHDVVVTPRSFMASASTVVMAGARPVWADLDRTNGNISAETIERALTPKTKAILPVHIAGWPCDMAPIMELARSRGLFVIEDCAQAHGAKLDGQSVGTFGDIASWSFCQDKIMTTAGEGGMLTMDREDLWEQCWSIKDHGKSFDAVYNRQHQPGFRWLHETFGTNWRMTEVCSAVGRAQLRKLGEWTEIRTRNAEIILSYLEPLPALRVEKPSENVKHAYYKVYFYVRPESLKSEWSRDRIMIETHELGVPLMSGSCCEMYLEKNFRDAGLAPSERLPVAKELGETSLMTLCHPTMSEEAAHWIGQTIATKVTEATR